MSEKWKKKMENEWITIPDENTKRNILKIITKHGTPDEKSLEVIGSTMKESPDGFFDFPTNLIHAKKYNNICKKCLK